MVSVTVHSYIMEVTSDFKKRWWAVTVHSYIMVMTSHLKKWAVSPQLYYGDDKAPYEEMVSCNSSQLYHGDDKSL